MESCPQINGHYPFPPGSTFRGFNQSPITQNSLYINNTIPNPTAPVRDLNSPTDVYEDVLEETGGCSHLRELIVNFNICKFLLLVASFVGILLILTGFFGYIYQLVEFKFALDRIYGNYERAFDCFTNSWILLEFIINLVLVWEIIGIFLVTLITSIVFIVACQSERMRQWNEATRLITKSFSLFFLGLLSCYIQTSMAIVRYTILTKINGWLDCKYGGH